MGFKCTNDENTRCTLLAEVRYKGTKVVSVSPDFAESTKFADDWISVKQGTDGALAMAMGHVILQEFYVDNQVEYFTKYAKQYTDFPFFVTLKQKGDRFVADRFLNASDIGRNEVRGMETCSLEREYE